MNAKMIFSFVTGMIIGTGVSFVATKRYFENRINAEYQEKKAAVTTDPDTMVDESIFVEEPVQKESVKKTVDIKEFYKKVTDLNYTTEDEIASSIQIIDPKEFGFETDYDTETIVYYQDHVVTDSHGTLWSEQDIDSYITHDALTHFGEYEEDTVYVKNNLLKTYYEILLDADPYYIGEDDSYFTEDGE